MSAMQERVKTPTASLVLMRSGVKLALERNFWFR